MKGLLRTGGVLLAAAGLVVVGRSWSGPPAKPAAPKTQVAFVNMIYVSKYADEWNSFQAEIKNNYKGFEGRLVKLKTLIDDLAKRAADSDTPAGEREDVETQLKKLKREYEELNDEAKKALGKDSDKAVSSFFKNVQQAAEKYANQHDLDAVFMYTETIDPNDTFNPQNVIAKLQNRASMPIYLAPGMDVSPEIVEALNAKKGGNVGPAQPAKK
jgi:Skp family chaperone for outer membrane proteins